MSQVASVDFSLITTVGWPPISSRIMYLPVSIINGPGFKLSNRTGNKFMDTMITGAKVVKKKSRRVFEDDELMDDSYGEGELDSPPFAQGPKADYDDNVKNTITDGMAKLSVVEEGTTAATMTSHPMAELDKLQRCYTDKPPAPNTVYGVALDITRKVLSVWRKEILEMEDELDVDGSMTVYPSDVTKYLLSGLNETVDENLPLDERLPYVLNTMATYQDDPLVSEASGPYSINDPDWMDNLVYQMANSSYSIDDILLRMNTTPLYTRMPGCDKAVPPELQQFIVDLSRILTSRRTELQDQFKRLTKRSQTIDFTVSADMRGFQTYLQSLRIDCFILALLRDHVLYISQALRDGHKRFHVFVNTAAEFAILVSRRLAEVDTYDSQFIEAVVMVYTRIACGPRYAPILSFKKDISIMDREELADSNPDATMQIHELHGLKFVKNLIELMDRKRNAWNIMRNSYNIT